MSQAIARQFGLAWRASTGSQDAWLTGAGRRIALDIANLPMPDGLIDVRPRLRFDRVTLRVIRDLKEALEPSIPENATGVVTVTAPIRLASKTVREVIARFPTLLARAAPGPGIDARIHGNRVRAQIMKAAVPGASRLVGFVHNPEPTPKALFNVTRALLDCIGAKAAARPATRRAGNRWLAIVGPGPAANFESYRQVYGQLGLPPRYARVLMVLEGRVETLEAAEQESR